MKKQDYKEQERHYYFFDYLFWLGEITWENYHKVNFKQPRGSDMLWACITLFIFMPVLTIAGHFLDDLAFEVFGAVLLIVYSVSVFMTDRLFGKIYPPSRRKAVVQQLHLVVKQDGGHVGFAFLLLLPGQHSIEPADGVLLQPAHGTAAVQNENKLGKILFHNKCPPFCGVSLSLAKGYHKPEGKRSTGRRQITHPAVPDRIQTIAY